MICARAACKKLLPYEPHPAQLPPHFCSQRCYNKWWRKKFFGIGEG